MNEALIKKTGYLFFVVIGSLLFPVLFFSCMYQTPPTSELVSPRIHIKGQPAGVTSINLAITGADMETIEKSIAVGDNEITIEVPAGNDRTFSLTMHNPSVTVTGEITEDLTAGEEVDITVPLELNETKLIIPDADYYNDGGRLVQIDDMTGSGWIERDYSDLGLGFTLEGHFIPYDVDFDDQGRIYVANFENNPSGGIIRFDHINDTNPIKITNEKVPALVVDRENDLVYFLQSDSESYYLYRCNLDGSNPYEYPLGSFGDDPFNEETLGLTIDDEGMLYLAYRPDGTAIQKINPAGSGSYEDAYWSGGTNFFDVMFKDGFIYAADADGTEIQKLNTDLNLLDTLGDEAEEPEFDGPRRFLAILNKNFYLIDEQWGDDDSFNSLVFFSDFNGLDFTSYQKSTDPFRFFNAY